MQDATVEARTRLLRLCEVRHRTGKSGSDVYADPTFPRPIKIGKRASAWVESEVDAWIHDRIAASRRAAA